jgi:hypothetical protein
MRIVAITNEKPVCPNVCVHPGCNEPRAYAGMNPNNTPIWRRKCDEHYNQELAYKKGFDNYSQYQASLKLKKAKKRGFNSAAEMDTYDRAVERGTLGLFEVVCEKGVVRNKQTGELFIPAVVDNELAPKYYVKKSEGTIWSANNSSVDDVSLTGLQPLSLTINNNGYLSVGMTIGNKTRTLQVHRIVGETLVEPDPHKIDYCSVEWNNLSPYSRAKYIKELVVHHIDHDKTNFHPSNLEWQTTKGNARAYQNHKNIA